MQVIMLNYLTGSISGLTNKKYPVIYVFDGEIRFFLSVVAITELLGGGGDMFASFLEEELIPHIDSLYPAAPYRVVIGHSLGGLTAINLPKY